MPARRNALSCLGPACLMAAGLLTGLPGAVRAAAPATTLLHLSATGSVQAVPDLLVADLVAQDQSASPAAAQARVNAQIAGGITLACAVPGIEASAVDYSVSPVDDKRTAWTAQQTLELRSGNAASLLDLAGKLQQRGFALASLDWRLSDPRRREASDAATQAALKTLRARIASVAAALGLRVDHIQDLQVDNPGLQPRPGLMMARMSAPAPEATATAQSVEASVSAEIVLRP